VLSGVSARGSAGVHPAEPFVAEQRGPARARGGRGRRARAPRWQPEAWPPTPAPAGADPAVGVGVGLPRAVDLPGEHAPGTFRAGPAAAVVVRRGLRPVLETVGLKQAVEHVEDDPRLHHGGSRVRVDGEQASRCFDQSITTPSLQHSPARLVPPPRDSTATPRSWQTATASTAASTVRGTTTPTGTWRKFDTFVEYVARCRVEPHLAVGPRAQCALEQLVIGDEQNRHQSLPLIRPPIAEPFRAWRIPRHAWDTIRRPARDLSGIWCVNRVSAGSRYRRTNGPTKGRARG
jgi:hypothetical protein